MFVFLFGPALPFAVTPPAKKNPTPNNICSLHAGNDRGNKLLLVVGWVGVIGFGVNLLGFKTL